MIGIDSSLRWWLRRLQQARIRAARDAAEMGRMRRELDFVTHFDRLTHLPNRQTFEGLLEGAMKESRRQGEALLLVCLDVDRFAEINDTLGYEQGDRLLVELASRLRRTLRAGDALSRISADEFLLAYGGLRRRGDIVARVRRLEEALREPFELGGRRHKITACLGSSVCPGNGDTAREMIRNADVAKNRAKRNGRGSVLFFKQRLHDELLHRHSLVDRLERALEEDELTLYYQPQVATSDGRIESLEALLRWEPRRGDPASPDEFIPLAEGSDLILRLGDWVMTEACRQRARWRDAGLALERIDINLSGRQMMRQDLLQRIESCLHRYALDPRHIGIELTENVLIDADEGVVDGLQRLQRQGLRITIDDFGIGYSSLSYLKNFPASALKIDRTFLHDASSHPKDRAIMEAAVLLGHRLGLEVVAEGVESAEQLELAREMGCDLAQGFYCFRPMAAAEIETILEEATPRRSTG